MKQPFFSIVTTAYNKEKYIKQCIFSVLNQTENDFEIIFVDDNSGDNTLSLVKNIDDQKIKIIEMPHNKGVSYCRNIALKEAAGEYILFVDGDDWLDNTLLERAKKELSEHFTDVLFFPYYLFWEEKRYRRMGSKFQLSRLKKYKKPADAKGAANDLINTNYEIWNKFFLRKFLINNDILFKEDLNLSEDLVFYARVLAHMQTFSYLDKCGYYYRSGLKKHNPKSLVPQFITAFNYAYDEIKGTCYESLFLQYASKILNWWIIKLNCSEELYNFACSFCKNQKIVDINSPLKQLMFKIFIRITSVM